MESKSYIYQNETPVEDLGGGVTRQILGYNEQLMMVKLTGIGYRPLSMLELASFRRVQLLMRLGS